MSPKEVIRRWVLVELANLWAFVHRWKSEHPARGQDTFLSSESRAYWLRAYHRAHPERSL